MPQEAPKMNLKIVYRKPLFGKHTAIIRFQDGDRLIMKSKSRIRIKEFLKDFAKDYAEKIPGVTNAVN